MKHFVVQGVDGYPIWQALCDSRNYSALLFLTKLRAIDPFQRMRDIGSDRPGELVPRNDRIIGGLVNRMRW